MERPEPKCGDVLIDRGYKTTIDGFDEDRGTRLYDGNWVCISDFVKNAEGAWVRESETMPGVPELERPVGDDAPQQLSTAVERLRQQPLRYTTDERYALLLADAMEKLARMGSHDAQFLNRVGGPQVVRLARYINTGGT